MSSSPTLSYKDITGLPEYTHYEFHFDWICCYVLTMVIYSILPILIFLQIAATFLTAAKGRMGTLQYETLHSFILMQFWNVLLILADFAMFRIPYTTFLTQFCASQNLQTELRTIVFVYFWATYCSQLFTVLFCTMRVLILYLVPLKVTEKLIKYLPSIITIFGLLAALPHFTTDAFCMQIASPYIFGSVLIISKFHSNNLYMVYFNFFIYLSVAVTIAVLNMMMVRKLRSSSVINLRSSSLSARIERTLTGTMIIMLFPLVVSLLISIGEIYKTWVFSYILLIRPLFLDARVHIVTCYFYLTHPALNRHASVSPQIFSVSQNMNGLW